MAKKTGFNDERGAWLLFGLVVLGFAVAAVYFMILIGAIHTPQFGQITSLRDLVEIFGR